MGVVLIVTEVAGDVGVGFFSLEENSAAVMAAPLNADAPAMIAIVVFDMIDNMVGNHKSSKGVEEWEESLFDCSQLLITRSKFMPIRRVGKALHV